MRSTANSSTPKRARSSSSVLRPPGAWPTVRCQIFGGRGYMREFPVERHWRELRVDRIWEGTSQIQRLVVTNELRKRGTRAYTAWPGGI